MCKGFPFIVFLQVADRVFTKAFVKASVTLPLFALVGVEARAVVRPTNNIPMICA